ncbi:MFS transporter [Microbacterium sp. 4-7]|uniref:MFS transporter n=1 Tax=Microbacterium sp. 4-7 TaxID=1885327 RepID=UPI00164F28DD|nr:MFS transporter [Microbacterium sp. 4-7]
MSTIFSRWGFGFAAAATTLLMVAASAPSPFYPEFARQLGLLPVATTLIFAIYAFTMLTALLLTGALSDTVGRRPLISAGALLLALSILIFWQSGDLTMLLFARAFQGIAAGVLLPALSAMVIDFAHPRRAEAASLWNTISAMIGLGIGAITAAIALDLFANATDVVFGSLTITFVLISALVWTTPEKLRPVRTRIRHLLSKPAVPDHLRLPFLVAVPAVIAGWATNGMFLALGSSVVKEVFDATTHAQQSLAIPVFAISGIAASVLLHRKAARLVSVYGTSALSLGTALSVVALLSHSLPTYLISVAIIGTGFGTAFMGVLKSLMSRIDPDERASVMAVIYTVSYLAFGVPTLIAGVLIPVLSLHTTAIILGVVIALLGAIAAVWRARIRDRSRADAVE